MRGASRGGDLPENPGALLLAVRLGCVDLADRIGLRGDLLLAGIGPDGSPADVPAPVLVAAIRGGLLRDETPNVAGRGTDGTAPVRRVQAGRQ